MIFWIAILAGVLFVWLAVRLGFYETWTLLFNIVVSIYVSIFLTPLLAELVPASGGASSYHTALCLVVLAGGCFALLQGLSFVFLTGQFRIPFPRVFDVVLSGVLGFVAGFLVLSFVALVLTTTPLARDKIVGVLGLSQESRPANLVCIARACDLIHVFAGSDAGGDTPRDALQRLLQMNAVHPAPHNRPPDANEPPVSGEGEGSSAPANSGSKAARGSSSISPGAGPDGRVLPDPVTDAVGSPGVHPGRSSFRLEYLVCADRTGLIRRKAVLQTRLNDPSRGCPLLPPTL